MTVTGGGLFKVVDDRSVYCADIVIIMIMVMRVVLGLFRGELEAETVVVLVKVTCVVLGMMDEELYTDVFTAKWVDDEDGIGAVLNVVGRFELNE